jgi:hypothetical protein
LPTVKELAFRARVRASDFTKPLVNAELSFVKRVCDPTEEQMAIIVEAARIANGRIASILTDHRMVEDHHDNHEIFVFHNQVRTTLNPYRTVRDDVAIFLQSLVSTEQYSRYISESKARDTFEREAAVETVLDMLDGILFLSLDQQSRLYGALIAESSLPDLHSLVEFDVHQKQIPRLPEHRIKPLLTESQKQKWDSLKRVNVIYSSFHVQSPDFMGDWLK